MCGLEVIYRKVKRIKKRFRWLLRIFFVLLKIFPWSIHSNTVSTKKLFTQWNFYRLSMTVIVKVGGRMPWLIGQPRSKSLDILGWVWSSNQTQQSDTALTLVVITPAYLFSLSSREPSAHDPLLSFDIESISHWSFKAVSHWNKKKKKETQRTYECSPKSAQQQPEIIRLNKFVNKNKIGHRWLNAFTLKITFQTISKLS